MEVGDNAMYVDFSSSISSHDRLTMDSAQKRNHFCLGTSMSMIKGKRRTKTEGSRIY